MQVYGFEFPELILDVPADGLIFPNIYEPYVFSYGYGKQSKPSYNVSFPASLLPAEVREDVYKPTKPRALFNDYVRVKSGTPPLVECSDMTWLLQQCQEAKAANRTPDHIFTKYATRLRLAPIPMRFMMDGNDHREQVQCPDTAVILLFDKIEVIKPGEGAAQSKPEVLFGFASYKGGVFELIVENRLTGERTMLKGQLEPGQLEQVSKILPTCVYVTAGPRQ